MRHVAKFSSNHQRGFTLVELAIVLVIVGLLVGGTLAGRSLIRNAEIRSALEEKEQYTAAINQFRSRFQYLPGDFPNATSYFGQSRYCGGASDLTTAACNGNGNQAVDLNLYVAVAAPYDEEPFYAWAHLFSAGLINTHYTGKMGTTNTDCIAGQNCPESKMAPGVWMLATLFSPSGGVLVFDGAYGLSLWLGAEGLDTSSANFYSVITAQEAYALDTKIDDGLPATGNLRVGTGSTNPNCAIKADLSGDATDGDLDAVYKTGKNDADGTGDTLTCTLIFPNIVK